MAKLFIGYEYIKFVYNQHEFQGALSRIVLDEKMIFRIDYTSNTAQGGRFEVSYGKNKDGQPQWVNASKTDPGLAQILIGEIEKNHEIFQLD
jgi:hypothetical protein